MNRYKELLKKFYSNEELIELLDLVVMDSRREKEEHYLKNKSYPDDRDLLGKLKTDLLTVRAYVMSTNGHF